MENSSKVTKPLNIQCQYSELSISFGHELAIFCSLAHAVTHKPMLERWTCTICTRQRRGPQPSGFGMMNTGTNEGCVCVCTCGVFLMSRACLYITVLEHADFMCVLSVTGPCCDEAEGLLVWAVVWHLTRGLQQWMMGQGQSVNLAMHTFIVGPWLPSGSVISLGLIHKPEMEKKICYDQWTVTLILNSFNP